MTRRQLEGLVIDEQLDDRDADEIRLARTGLQPAIVIPSFGGDVEGESSAQGWYE